jgi:ATP-dependent Clp protease adaptor protein ClpS
MPAFASAAAAEPVATDQSAVGPIAAEPVVAPRPRERRRRKRQPRYHVILWNDDDHTYEYVVRMLRTLFGHSPATGFQMAREVDTQGRVIVLTTTLEHAELKRDQIHAFGADRLIARSQGSMSASIEPVPVE